MARYSWRVSDGSALRESGRNSRIVGLEEVVMERGRNIVCRNYSQAPCASAALVLFMTNAKWQPTKADARAHRTRRPIPLEELMG